MTTNEEMAEEEVERMEQRVDGEIDELWDLGSELEGFGKQLQDKTEFADAEDDLEMLESMVDELSNRVMFEIQEKTRGFEGAMDELRMARENLEQVKEAED